MNHATPLELHDHAYGFRTSAHVAGCARCRESVSEIGRERSAIKDALTLEAVSPPEELLRAARPARRTTFSVAGLAAAALLLGALAWLLFRAPRGGEVDRPAAAAQADGDLDRLIAELGSASPIRREMAALALRAYGPAAAEKLEKAHADPAVVDGCRGISPQMRAVYQKLDTLKIDLEFQNTKPVDILDFIRGVSGLSFHLQAADARTIDRPMTLAAKGVSLRTSLQLMCDQLGLKFWVTEALVVSVVDKDFPDPEVKVPIRIRTGSRNAAKEIEALGSDTPDVRDRATAALRRLGFAAERGLWEALDGGNPERRARAGDLLRSLYASERQVEPSPTEAKMRTTRITIDMENAPLTAIAEYMSEVADVSILIDTSGIKDPASEQISFKVADIVLDGALRLMLQPRGKEYAVVDDLVVLTKSGAIRKIPKPPFLASPPEAKRMEGLLLDLESADPDRASRAERELLGIGEPALGPVAEASKIWDGEAGGRARALGEKIARNLEGWVPELPSGSDLATLTAPQRALLDRRFTLPLSGTTLKDVLGGLGLKTLFKAGESLKPRGSCRDARVGTFLRATLRPAGLDFTLDGETIVVDTAENIQKVMKK